jgi:hypothetical protein
MPAEGPPLTFDHPGFLEFPDQLFQIFDRDFLTPGHFAEGNRFFFAVYGQIDDQTGPVTAFGGKSHTGIILVFMKMATIRPVPVTLGFF